MDMLSLKILYIAKPKLVRQIIKSAKPELINDIAILALNLVKNNRIKLSTKERNRFKKYIKQLNVLACKEKSIKIKHRLLKKSSYKFVKLLIGNLLPYVSKRVYPDRSRSVSEIEKGVGAEPTETNSGSRERRTRTDKS